MTLIVSDDGPVRIIMIDRPQRRNAVDSATAAELLEAFTAFDADEAASVAVLTGADGAFCAGADLKALAEGDRRPVSEEGPGPMGPTGCGSASPSLPPSRALPSPADSSWPSGATCGSLLRMPCSACTAGGSASRSSTWERSACPG